MFPIFVIKGKDGLTLSFEATPVMCHYALMIPEMRYFAEDDLWKCPLAQEGLVRSFGEFCRRRGLSDGILFVSSVHDIDKDFSKNMRSADIPPSAPFSPYEYQSKGIQYILDKKRTFVADDMGLGKTFQAVCACWMAKSYPVLVVCPLAMRETWEREFREWTKKSSLIMDGTHRHDWWRYTRAGSYPVVIVNYESLGKYFVERVRWNSYKKRNIVTNSHVREFRTVIVDECHRTKAATSQSSVLLEAICDGAEYVLMLSGTPVVLGNGDLVEQLRIMGRLGEFGGERQFRERYCRGGSRNSHELQLRLWKTCFFRRDKSLVLPGLPCKTRQMRYVDIDNRETYMKVEEDLGDFLRLYVKLSRKRVRKAMRGEIMVRLSYLRQVAALGKVNEARRIIKEHSEKGEKLIVFVFHKRVVEEIKRIFPHAVTITGSDTAQEKQMAIDAFQNCESQKLIIVNYRSGGCGLTLTAGCKELFVELPWTSADCDQSEARAHRNGQKREVECIYLIGRNTIDEKILEVIEEERQIVKSTVGAKDDARIRNINAVISKFGGKVA